MNGAANLAPGALLAALAAAVLWMSRRPAPPWWLTKLPPPLWCYFLPMLAATLGWLPHQAPVYTLLMRHALPPCLILLLLGADLGAILRLGPLALGSMAAGTAGIMLGAPLALAACQPWLPRQAWLGVGALAGSWIGGSANMLAVREALAVPDAVFTPMIVVDTLMAYGWMGLLIALAAWQPQINRWLRADDAWLAHLRRAAPSPQTDGGTWSARAGITLAAMLASLACVWAGGALPAIGAAISHRTWAVVLATAVGTGWSCHAWTRRRSATATRAGTFLLYLLLTAIGATADLRSILQAPAFLVLGAIWLCAHGIVLVIAGRWWRAPVFFLATASQANVGGPASAPIVASVYQPTLAPVGLLLAVLGNVLGTYLGMLVAALCRCVAAAYGLG